VRQRFSAAERLSGCGLLWALPQEAYHQWRPVRCIELVPNSFYRTSVNILARTKGIESRATATAATTDRGARGALDKRGTWTAPLTADGLPAHCHSIQRVDSQAGQRRLRDGVPFGDGG